VNTLFIFWALENSGNCQLNEIVPTHKGLRYTELVIIIIIIIIMLLFFSPVTGLYSLVFLLKQM
jgi:hypothetical protein